MEVVAGVEAAFETLSFGEKRAKWAEQVSSSSLLLLRLLLAVAPDDVVKCTNFRIDRVIRSYFALTSDVLASAFDFRRSIAIVISRWKTNSKSHS